MASTPGSPSARRSVIQIGCVVQVSGVSVRVQFDVEHALGDDPPVPGAGQAGVLNRVLQIEQHARSGAGVTLIHQDRAPAQQITVALKREVDRGVQQRMAGAQERGQGLALRGDECLLERDALVARQHGLANANQAVPVAHRRGDVGDLVPSRFPLLDGTAKSPEGFQEEGLDVVRLQPAGLGPLHLFAHAEHARRVHAVMRQRPFFEQVLQLGLVEGVRHHLRQPRADFGPFAVADRFDQQVAQRLPLELELAQHVEHLPAERLTRLLQLLQKGAIDIALAGLFGNQVPEVADFGLCRCGGCGRSAVRCGSGSTAGRS